MKGTILITGASTGIGRATAELLAQRGYRVYAGVRSEHDAERLDRTVPGRLVPVLLDVTPQDQIDLVATRIERDHSEGLLALINNAGFNYNSAFEYTDEAQAAALMEVNFFGLCNLTRRMIPSLRRFAIAERGVTSKIVNISSVGGLVGIPWQAYYHASKFAVIGVTESLRHELWDQGIRPCVVCPGGIVTEFLPKTDASIQQAIAALPGHAEPAYAKGLNAIRSQISQVTRFGSKPVKVAEAIHAILQDQNPSFRHLVGLDAKLIYATSRALPTSWFHALLRTQFAS